MPKPTDSTGATSELTEPQRVVLEPTARGEPAWVGDPTTIRAAAVAPDPPAAPTVGAVARARQMWLRLRPLHRNLIVGTVVFASGLALGALLWSGGVAHAPDELARFARRVTGPEGETARRALALGDEVSALSVFRTPGAYDHLRADPMAQALRARLALATKDPADALDWLEQALSTAPELTKEDWAADAVVQTWGASKPGRTGALLARVPKVAATAATRLACGDWQYRVRHGAADALKALGDSCPDPIGFLILDAWQADRCELARPAVKALAAASHSDDRIAPVLDAVGRRPAIQGCVADLLPHSAK